MKYLTIVLLIVSFQVKASYVSNEECVQVYRDAALELKEIAEDFNRKNIDKFDVGIQVSAITAAVGAQRIACRVVENPQVRPCVDNAKKLYESIRSEINVRSILVGNQTKIETRLDFRASLLFHNLKCHQYE